MGFFEFESEFNEAVASARPQPSGGSASSRPPARTPTATARPVTPSKTVSRASGTTKPITPTNTTPGAKTAGKQGGTPAKQPAPATKPAPAPAKSSGTTGKGILDAFGKLVPQLVDFGQLGVQTYQRFAGSGGQPAPGAAGQPPGGDVAVAGGQPPPPGVTAEPTPSGAPEPASSTPPGGGYTTAPAPQPYAGGYAGQPATGFDQLGLLLQALRHHQIPPLPGPPAYQPAAPFIAHQPRQADGLALLRLILTNPQLQQALQSGAAAGPVQSRTVALPVPATAPPHQGRSVAIPMGAVMNAIAALAGQSMTELNESTPEDDPEVPSYLVDDQGDFLVDPANSQDRAALVAHWFRVSNEAERFDAFHQPSRQLHEADSEQDESEAWALEAGFAK